MAVIAKVCGLHVTVGGDTHSGWLPLGAAVPKPTPIRDLVLDLRIESNGDDCLLIWEAQDPFDCGDSWHATLEEAQTAAQSRFGVAPTDWQAPA